MATYLDPTEPSQMTTQDRLAEVVAILAKGVLRLRRHHALDPNGHSNPRPSFHSPDRLDVSARMQHMDAVVNAAETSSPLCRSNSGRSTPKCSAKPPVAATRTT
jgi:hypothetical protein